MSFTRPPAVEAIVSNPAESRDNVVDLLRDLLKPLQGGMSAGHGRIRIGHTGTHFDHRAAEMEGFARALWGLAPLLAVQPDHPDFTRMAGDWVDGLDHGTDPDHEDYWGKPGVRDQRHVELAAIAIGLLLAPKSLWEPLSDQAKDRVVAYLSLINDKTTDLPPNNWFFFRVLVNISLRSVGRPYSSAQIDSDLEHIETYYTEEGRPADGPIKHCMSFDYYATSFAIPFYSLIYAHFSSETDPVRSQKFKERALQNISEVIHLFAPDGNAIAFGRSMTYRFAASCFFSSYAYIHQQEKQLPGPFSWGQIKGVILRNIRSFTQKDTVFRPDGSLEIGWFHPSTYLSEDYNSPQSPYWALKAFLILALPAQHPFWTAKEEPYPTSCLEKPFVANKTWHQVFSHAAGHTYLIGAGQHLSFPQRGAQAKYGKFAYSAAFGFSLPAGPAYLSQHAPDSVLALSDDADGERWRMPRVLEFATVRDDGVVVANWKPWSDVEVTSWLVPPSTTDCAFHMRFHRLKTARQLKASDGGWAISNQYKGSPVRVADQVEESDLGAQASKKTSAVLVSPAGVSGVVDLFPSHVSTATVERLDSSTNVVSPRTSLPLVMHEIQPGEVWFGTLIFGIPSTNDGTHEWYAKWSEAEALSGKRSLEEYRTMYRLQ